MKHKLVAVCAMLIGFATAAAPAFGHHGYAAYDMTKTVTLSGTITSYKMANPHSTITFDVPAAKGKVEHWSAEFGYVRAMKAAGWTTTSLQAGDQVTVEVHPAKNGAFVSSLARISLSDGRILRMGAGGE